MKGVCCVPNCKNDISTSGHVFPKDTTIRSLWLKKIKRSNWTPGKWSKICHHHLKPTDFLVFNKAGWKNVRKLLKQGAVTSMFPWNWNKIINNKLKKTKDKKIERERSIKLLIESILVDTIAEESIRKLI
ncbi:peroxynitrite isomerase THAP4-like [Phymastichus coffea]|uniref:peroxynitrite isomerase THAP4-like n=1 Tax=Phymastichus coffea TaxID=108790 RepID=UPI00273AD044|nr:peroxynitrite isomerase THAP4-like [Phymastichus coffea]